MNLIQTPDYSFQQSGEIILPKSIFNSEKTDYATPSLFMGQAPGLLDSINKYYPKLWNLYKKLKGQDWDENEQKFEKCKIEFKTAPKAIVDIMIMNLAYQWETDSVASRIIASIGSQFCTSSEMWVGWQRIADNESIHGLTYSEIIRNGFDDNQQVMANILQITETKRRLDVVSRVFADAHELAHKLALGQEVRCQRTYNIMFLFMVALWCMERIQFVVSFHHTFEIARSGMFIPIGKAVQKICADELDIHALFDQYVLDYELSNEWGITAFNQLRGKIKQIIDAVVMSERHWNQYVFSEGRHLPHKSAAVFDKVILFHAAPLYSFFGLDLDPDTPKNNPTPDLERWTHIDSIQDSPQEEKGNKYLMANFVSDFPDGAITPMR